MKNKLFIALLSLLVSHPALAAVSLTFTDIHNWAVGYGGYYQNNTNYTATMLLHIEGMTTATALDGNRVTLRASDIDSLRSLTNCFEMIRSVYPLNGYRVEIHIISPEYSDTSGGRDIHIDQENGGFRCGLRKVN